MSDETTEANQADDELDLEPEALKDLTDEPQEAEQVVGGATAPGGKCETGTW